MMHGHRLPDGTDWSSTIRLGDYWKSEDGIWYAETPNGLLVNLSGHTVVEHDDRTISVLPSILVHGGRQQSWHGFLERGVWREC